LEGGDSFPTDFGKNPPKDILTFAISDEAEGASYGDDTNENYGYMAADIEKWTQMIGERNIDGKLALIAVQEGGWGTSSTPEKLIPANGYIPPFASLYENYPRDDSVDIPGFDPTIPGSNQPAVSLGLSILKDAFLAETNNGTELPFALGVFIDDTGSVRYDQVDEAAHEFLDWVRNTYPQIAVSSQHDGSSWNNGIYSAVSERWIEQGQIAVEGMLDSDPVIKGTVSLGTLDNEKSGVKGLMDGAYDLADFDISELVEFEQKLSEALAVNGSESSRAEYELGELTKKSEQMELAYSRIVDADFAAETTRMAKHQILTQSSARMVSEAVRLTDVVKKVMGDALGF